MEVAMSVVGWFKKRLNVERFGRFALIGVLGTGLDTGLLLLLTTAGLPTLPANVISYSVGIINNYFWNRRWTFATPAPKHWVPQLAKFGMVSLVGLVLNSLMVVWLENGMGLPAAKLVATGAVLFWNYNVNRLWTFSDVAKVEVMEWSR
jgi:dolichol-phosphate mannosyltransferase